MVYGRKYPRGFSNEFIVCAFESEDDLEAAGYKRVSRDEARKLVRPNYYKGTGVSDHRKWGNVCCKTDHQGREDLEFWIEDVEWISLPRGAPRKVFLI